MHVHFARNVPLDRLDPQTLMASRTLAADEMLYVICRAGSRGEKACQALRAAGFTQVANVVNGTLGWDAARLPVVRGRQVIPLERQVRIAQGLLIVLGALLGLTANIHFLWLPAAVGAGMVFAGVTDTCPLGMLMARMPWNQVRSSPASAGDPSAQSCCC